MRLSDFEPNPGPRSKTDSAVDSGVWSDPSLTEIMQVLQNLSDRSLNFDKGPADMIKTGDEIKQSKRQSKVKLLVLVRDCQF